MTTPAVQDDAWSRDPATLERIIHAALTEGDATGVVAALTLLALVDPDRAELLRETMLVGIRLAGKL